MLKIAFSDIYHHPLPEGHRFPMEKYSLIPEQLVHEGICNPENFFTPSLLSDNQVLRTHDPNYWEKLKHLRLSRAEQRRTGFPLSKSLVQRELTICQGTIDCAVYALENGVALNVAGGTHHAFRDRGEGFCLLNDIAIASHWLLDNTEVNKILVVDLDVHQGNGTASIMKKEERVFTFSMHGTNNYPLEKEKSDLDVPLDDNTDDNSYLNKLSEFLPSLIEDFKPDFIFYQSGVDVLKTDKLGRLAMTIQGCKERDKFVLESCRQASIPLAISMGGGYSTKLAHIVEAHVNTFKLAYELFF